MQNTWTAGFEPARGFPNGLAGHRLNHSAKSTLAISKKIDSFKASN